MDVARVVSRDRASGDANRGRGGKGCSRDGHRRNRADQRSRRTHVQNGKNMYGMFMPTKGFYDAPVVVAAVATEQFNAFEAMGCDMDEFCVETLAQATDHSDASLCDLIEDIAGQLRVLARRFLSGALQRTVACGVRGEGKRFVAYGTPPPQDIRWRRGRPTWGWWSCRKDGVVRRRRPSFMNATSHTVWRALRANISLLVVAFRFARLRSHGTSLRKHRAWRCSLVFAGLQRQSERALYPCSKR